MMSREEIQEQHERISTIAVQMDETSLLIKKAVKLWPVVSFIGIIIGGIIGFSWGAFEFNASLIKRPEFDAHLKIENSNTATVMRYHIIDSTINGTQNNRLDKLETTPKWRLTKVNQVKDKYGIIQEREVN